MSLGSPVWPSGTLATSFSRAGPFIEASIGVSIRPGAMALAVMPCRAPSRAMVRVRPTIPALAAT